MQDARCKMEMQDGDARWRCKMEMQDGDARWRCKMPDVMNYCKLSYRGRLWIDGSQGKKKHFFFSEKCVIVFMIFCSLLEIFLRFLYSNYIEYPGTFLLHYFTKYSLSYSLFKSLEMMFFPSGVSSLAIVLFKATAYW